MIQDRLTAKFLSPSKATPAKAVTPAKLPSKPAHAPAADIYTRGRAIVGSFWL